LFGLVEEIKEGGGRKKGGGECFALLLLSFVGFRVCRRRRHGGGGTPNIEPDRHTWNLFRSNPCLILENHLNALLSLYTNFYFFLYIKE
jgi:hypothetical protein